MKGTGTKTELQCPQARRLFSPYLDGAVTGTEMLALQEHLTECASCNGQYQGLRRTQQLMASVGRPKAPAGDFTGSGAGQARTVCRAESTMGKCAAGLHGSRHSRVSKRSHYFWNRDGVFRSASVAARGQ